MDYISSDVCNRSVNNVYARFHVDKTTAAVCCFRFRNSLPLSKHVGLPDSVSDDVQSPTPKRDRSVSYITHDYNNYTRLTFSDDFLCSRHIANTKFKFQFFTMFM